MIQCLQHGPQPHAFVCQHIVASSAAAGFHSRRPARAEERSDAWCDGCEVRRSALGGWRGAAAELLGITLICGPCYDAAKAAHSSAST